jgi:hypothetical protein
VKAEQAANLAYASDVGTLWFTLRPRTGAKQTPATFVTKDTQVLRVGSGQALTSCGGRK